MHTGLFLAEAATETAAALTTEYAGVQVPVLNIILEGFALIFLLGAVLAGILLLRNHVREWLYPFGIGLVFNLVLQYMLFNARFGLVLFLLSLLSEKTGFLKDSPQYLQLIVLVLQAGCAVLTVLLGMRYWINNARKTHRQVSLGGAIAFGFAFYVVGVISSGWLGQLYAMLSNSQAINSTGFDAILESYLATAETENERRAVTDSLLSLADANPWPFIQCVLQSILVALECFAPIAASVIHYGVVNGRLEKKWHFAAIALHLAVFLPSIIACFTGEFGAFFYIAFGFILAVAVISVLLTIYLSRTYLPEEWSALGYTRKKQKQDAEREKNKIPKIVMPKD